MWLFFFHHTYYQPPEVSANTGSYHLLTVFLEVSEFCFCYLQTVFICKLPTLHQDKIALADTYLVCVCVCVLICPAPISSDLSGLFSLTLSAIYERGTIIVLILQVRRVRYRQVK